MTDPIDPPRPVRGDRRQTARRANDPPPTSAQGAGKGAGQGAAQTTAQLPVPVAPAPAADAKPILSAHLIGQEGQKRGLRGGPETLSKAKAAYLTAEWSGPTDRRNRAGVMSKTKI
ncbi:MAG TPA: hypothetical protein VMU59_01725 [Caulobacteraceae bacterium]|nr:hypothetical protein [Caulobacteraceae bacterium]